MFPGGFIPNLDDGGVDVLVAQANFLPGGCLLTAALYHAASDGVALFTFGNIWADNCKAAQSGGPSVELLPGISDRSLLGDIWRREAAEGVLGVNGIGPRHLLGLSDSKTIVKSTGSQTPGMRVQRRNSSKMISAIFYIPAVGFRLLLDQCVGENNSGIRVSGNDAVCALIWRHSLRARAKAATQSRDSNLSSDDSDPAARLDMILDGRLDFSSSVPPTYLGNLTATVQPQLPLSELTGSDTPLITVARVIREATLSVNQATLFEAYALLNSWPDYDGLQVQKTQRRSGLHGHSLLVTSLLPMPLHTQVAFGGGVFANGGVPDASRLLMGSFKHASRICFILPRKKSGAVEFILNLFEDELELLMEDDEFAKYAMFLS